MKLDIFQKIGIVFGLMVLLYISIDTLLTKPVNKENSTVVMRHFEAIERFKIKNKVSVSYNLFTQELQESYKILPEYIDCFNYKDFREEVKRGQLIEISIRNDNGLRSSKMPIVVSLIANGKNYLDQNCINQEIKNGKIKIPLICGGFIIIIGLLIYIKNRKRYSL